jgi:hypothetical protein
MQSFKSPAIVSAITRYSYLDMVSLFELMCNLAAIARYNLIYPAISCFQRPAAKPLNPLFRALVPCMPVILAVPASKLECFSLLASFRVTITNGKKYINILKKEAFLISHVKMYNTCVCAKRSIHFHV